MSEQFAWPSVSVLLPAWNEAATLAACLESLRALAVPDLEIIVCAGGSDGTLGIARGFASETNPTVIVLEQRNGEGKQVALRRCYEASTGEVIYLTDADCVVSRETLLALVQPVVEGQVDATTGPAEPFPEQRDKAWVRHQWATNRAVDRGRGAESAGILGRNCAVGRSAVEEAGGFRDPVAIGTDYHFAKMLLAGGCSIRFVDSPVQTWYSETVGGAARQHSRWMRNVLIHGRRFGAEDEVRSVVRTIVTGTVVSALPLTWPWTKMAGVGIWAALLGWMSRIRLRQLRALEAEQGLEPIDSQQLHAVFFSLGDLVLWTRPLFDLVSARRRLRW